MALPALDLAILVGWLVVTVAVGLALAGRSRTVGDFVLAGRDLPAWALLVSMGPRRGTNRPGHMAELRKAIAGARKVRERRKQAGDDAALAGKPKPGAKPDPRTDPILAWLDGKTPGLLWCQSASDLHRAVALLEKEKVTATLLLGADGWRVIETASR